VARRASRACICLTSRALFPSALDRGRFQRLFGAGASRAVPAATMSPSPSPCTRSVAPSSYSSLAVVAPLGPVLGPGVPAHESPSSVSPSRPSSAPLDSAPIAQSRFRPPPPVALPSAVLGRERMDASPLVVSARASAAPLASAVPLARLVALFRGPLAAR
jgi:hypothetical protein